jgi:hypothetical protein
VEPGDVTISTGETSTQKVSGSLNCPGGNRGGAIIEFPAGSVGPNKETTAPVIIIMIRSRTQPRDI